jgi:pimeloyl-ACP methyl ester carboxylesterase
MHLTNPCRPCIEEQCDPSRLHPNGYFEPPARFEVPGADGRLTEELREPLRRHLGNPVYLLAEATRALLCGDVPLANALADLAVTGRHMHERFRAGAPQLGQVVEAATRPADDSFVRVLLRALAGRALERAYRVAWALQGLVPRRGLGWIAVSGEDDPPHRPANVPGPSLAQHALPQHDLVVQVQPTAHARGRSVTTRCIVARRGAEPTSPVAPAEGVRTLMLPPEQPVTIAPHERLLLYVHGHGSRLEECLDLAAALAGHGFTVVAMDLPGCGYASMFDHTEIADAPQPGSLASFPILDFIEQFLVDFVPALEQRVGRAIRHQIAAVLGGGLGGNMALRLAQRDLTVLPFLANVVAWSPACVWAPSTDPARRQGPELAHARMSVDPPRPGEPGDRPGLESPERRLEHFWHVFEEVHPEVHLGPPSEYWSRRDWPRKPERIAGARADRRETYNRWFRRWHWRVGYEQLLYSHSVPGRWEKIRARTLLVAGGQDDHPWTHVYDATRDLGVLLLTTPGRRLLVEQTGHALHAERPQWLAAAIRDFVPPPRPIAAVREVWTSWRRLGGILTSRPAVGVNEDGRLEVFARGADKRMHHTWQTAPSGSWAGTWAALQGGLASTDDLGKSIAVASHGDGRLDVFAHLADGGRITHVWQTAPNHGWSQWDRGDSIQQFIGKAQDGVGVIDRVGRKPAEQGESAHRLGVIDRWLLAAALVHDGWIHICGRNAKDWWWSGQYVGRSTPTFVGAPVLAQNRDGRLEIFARDRSGVMYHIWETAPDRWHDTWEAIGSGGVTGDAAVALTVDGRLEIFACSSRRELVHAWQTEPNGSFTGWSSLGGSLDHASTPAVARNAWGELQVFVRWQDGSTRHRRLLPDRGWQWADWQSLNGLARTDPVVAANADGRLAVFVVGAAGALYVSEQTTAG